MGNTILEGIRVLDFTRALAGPHCSLLLADMGAEVIKVENPKDATAAGRRRQPAIGGISMFFANVNRNKYGASLDLKQEEGKNLFRRLVESADVLIENNRPGVLGKLGFSYDDCKAINPRIIYASISGFGQTGKYCRAPGYDNVAQAMGGGMSVTGYPSDPPTSPGIPLCDVFAGMNTCNAVMAALVNRAHTGEGQYVEVALVDGMVSALSSMTPIYRYGGVLPTHIGNRCDIPGGPVDSYAASDGGNVVISCNGEKEFAALANVLGKPELCADVRFATPEARQNSANNGDPLHAIIEAWTSLRTADEAAAILRAAGVTCGPVHNFTELFADEHIIKDREMLVKVNLSTGEEMTITGNPIKMSRYPATFRKACPHIGEDNDRIFTELGFSPEELAAARKVGALL